MAKKNGKNRYIPEVRNYAEFMRKTRVYHDYTFKLPRPRVTNALIDELSKTSTYRGWAASGKYTKKQLEKKLKRYAIDKSIDEQLTSRQKSAITRQWHGTRHQPGLKHYIGAVNEKRAQFIKNKQARRSHMLRQHKHTNKGFFIHEPENAKIRIKGKGVNMEFIIVRRPGRDPKTKRQVRRREERYIPFPRGVDIPAYIAYLYKLYEPPPRSMAIAVMGAPGKKEHPNITGLKYIVDAIRGYEVRGKMHPFSGIYFYWY